MTTVNDWRMDLCKSTALRILATVCMKTDGPLDHLEWVHPRMVRHMEMQYYTPKDIEKVLEAFKTISDDQLALVVQTARATREAFLSIIESAG